MQDVDDPKIVGLGSRIYSIISHLKFLSERVAYSITRNDELIAFKKKSCLNKAKDFDEEQSHFTSLISKNILKQQELHKRAQSEAEEYNANLPIVEEMMKAYNEAKAGHALTVTHLKNELKAMQLALKKLKLAKSGIVSSKMGAATQLLEIAASKSNIRSKLHAADDDDDAAEDEFEKIADGEETRKPKNVPLKVGKQEATVDVPTEDNTDGRY